MNAEELAERKEVIVEVSDEVLTYLLEYKRNHPEFVFYLRQRDFVNSNEVRFANGFGFKEVANISGYHLLTKEIKITKQGA